MSTTTTQRLAQRKRRIQHRLAPRNFPPNPKPVFTAANIHYELSGRDRAISCGGLGAIHLLARQVGLVQAIDRDLQLLKVHLPYQESDHVLNIAPGGGAYRQHPRRRRLPGGPGTAPQ